jgi:hypothetical protein
MAKTDMAKSPKTKKTKAGRPKTGARKSGIRKTKTTKTAKPSGKAKRRGGASVKKPTRRMATPVARQPAPRAAPLLVPLPIKHLVAGAGVPPGSGSTVFDALNAVAATHNVDPAAIAGIINTESGWDTDWITGQCIGLTQVGAEFVAFLKMTQAQFLALPADAQINAYGTWLDYYQFDAQMTGLNIVVAALPLPQQAAVLQGMQFAPGARAWKAALAKGDLSVPTTAAPPETFPDGTSVGEMADYYSKFFRQHPPVYARDAESR